MTQTIQYIPLTKLIASDSNVRRTGRMEGVDELAASIHAHGLLQNLTVRGVTKGKKKTLFEVIAGGRRLAALKSLARTKAIGKDAPIACHVLDGEIAEEISLAENQHEPMHPADEYEAFALLNREHGISAEDIAARFGVTPAVVKQRLKLGAVSPVLLKLYREGEMNLDQLTAFTLTDDHARQEQVWESLGYDRSRRAILHDLTEGQVSTEDRRVAFVGLEVYETAGGTMIRDLFDEEGGYLADAPLLNRLVREKLETVAEMVRGEGWKWVAVEVEFDYHAASEMRRIETCPRPLTTDEEQTLADLQGKLESLCAEAEQDDASEDVLTGIDRVEAEIALLTEEIDPPEQIARAGAFVAVGRDGLARIEHGYLRPEDVRGEASDRDDGEAEAGSQTARNPDGLSAALVADLTARRTAALRNDLAQAPELALIAVTHALAAQTFYVGESVSCLGLIVRQASLSGHAPDIEDSVAERAIAQRHQAWAERLPQDAASLWSFVSALTMDDLLALLAHCASLALDAVRRPGARPDQGVLTHADTLARTMPHAMSRYWQPTAANYLSRVSKEQILAAVREAVGDDAARQLDGMKKPAMAARAEQLLAGTGWLPALLRPANDCAAVADL